MLYGWIEVGASNSSLFSGTNNDDIIIRTVYNSKIIMGNTNGSQQVAAMYVYGNNVGINKVPDADVDLDVNGRTVMKNLVVGFSNYVGDAVLNGRFLLKDTAKNYATATEFNVLNSNENVYFTYNNIERVRITNGQGVYVTDNMYISRDAYAEAFQVTSDIRCKTNIEASACDDDLERIKALSVYDYDINNKSCKGFLAQEVKAVMPQSIRYRQGYIPFKNTFATYSNNKLTITPESPSQVCDGALVVSLVNPDNTINPVKVTWARGNMMHIDSLTSETPLVDGEVFPIQGIYAEDIHTIDTNQLLATSINALKALQTRLEKLENYVYENKC